MKRNKPLRRTPFKSTPKPMKRVSDKRRRHWQSAEGKAEFDYMKAVKSLPCCICGRAGPSDAHHCIHDRYGSAKRSGFDTIPLCKSHHQDGPEAIHNGKETWREKHGPDYDYIEPTQKLVASMATCL